MRIKTLIPIIVSMLLFMTGCYRTITGTVVDAETGKPIEGAVILAEWTITKGLGYTGTYSYKVIEAITDKDGKISLSGNIINPFINRPIVTVYKKGYVAWNNEYIFPDDKKRDDFSWSNGYVFKLERFKGAYSYYKHWVFVENAIRTQLGTEKKQLFYKTFQAAEFENARREMDKK